MNYLAHAYLSFNNEEILLGNMSSDFIKGKKKFDYSIGIQKGIMLHRSIDTFTDNHPSTAEAKRYFKEAVGTYSGAFVDVAYDHFLATDTNEFPNEQSLQNFATQTYQQLQNNIDLLPERLQKMLPYMQSQNWLFNYSTRWGIEKSFEGVSRRAVYLDNFSKAFESFNKHYDELKVCYNAFFPDLKILPCIKFNCCKIPSRISSQKQHTMKRLFPVFIFCCMSIISFAQQKPTELDKSPMDMSYWPKDYPILKMSGKSKDLPTARLIYGRPQKNGRVIFGGINKYNEVWRLGANEATEVEFFKNVKIGGKAVVKGRYTLYCIPQENKWTIIVSKDNFCWGSFIYDPKKDLLRTDISIEKNTETIEALTMYFDETGNGANLIIMWDDIKATLPISL